MESNTHTGPAEQYFNGDRLASSVYLDKYAARDIHGEVVEHSPREMLKDRIAPEFAKRLYARLRKDATPKKLEKLSEKGKEKFSALSSMSVEDISEYIYNNYFEKFHKIVPQGRVLAGLGVEESYRSLSNCLRLPSPKDSYSSVMYVDAMLVSAAKRGCGYGLGISSLRPGGSSVANAAGRSTGAVSFMGRFSSSTKEVAQKGRRGACLIDIHVDHPEVQDFIYAKSDSKSINEANISIKVTDEFMDKAIKGEDYLHKFPIDTKIEESEKEYIIKSANKDEMIPHRNGVVKVSNAAETLDKAAENACRWGCPGLQFVDTTSNYDPASVYSQYQVDGTNACGEQPMSVYETCRLITLNLSSFVIGRFGNNPEIDTEGLYDSAYFQLILGDVLVDMEMEYLDRIITKIESDPEAHEEKAIELALWKNVKDITKEARRVGCGITALGDMIAALNIEYGNSASFDLVEQVMKKKMEAELDASIDLAILHGTFDGYSHDLEFPNGKGGNSFYKMLDEQFPATVERMKMHGRRNTNWSTIAPCGTVSILTQSTSGCEPLFSPFYVRRIKISDHDAPSILEHAIVDDNGMKWREELVVHYGLIEYAKMRGVALTKDNIREVFESSPYHNALAHNLDYDKRLKMQSILQKYTTSAISSTLNLPKGTTPDTVKKIYIESWMYGLKGQTIYVDGSKGNVLTDAMGDKTEKPKDRPIFMPCEVHHLTVNKKKYYAVVGIINKEPYEIFTGINEPTEEDPTKVPICKSVTHGRVVRVASGKYNMEPDSCDKKSYVLSGQHDDPMIEAITRLVSMSLKNGVSLKDIVKQLSKTDGHMFEFVKVLSRVLKKYIKDQELIDHEPLDGCETPTECNIVMQEGCKMCKTCGKGKCG